VTDFLTNILSTVSWPLPIRPSLDNLAVPEVRATVATALMQLGLAALLISLAIMVRRGRVVVLLAAGTLIALRLPSLDLLLVDAYPTSFWRSPAGFTANAIDEGHKVFAANCVLCHGRKGDGAGGAGDVANLHQAHIWEHPAGDLFWYVSHGIEDADGAQLMPAFGTRLTASDRWSAIDYVYALNAGTVAQGLNGWPHRVRAPDVPLSCDRIAARALRDLRGKAIRLVTGALTGALRRLPPVNGIDVVTVWIPGNDTEAAAVPGVDCIARSGAAAYAILAGTPDGTVTAARFLIDPDGVLRSVWRADDGDPFSDPERLLEELRTVCTEPLITEPGVAYEHHH
jgi:mono/diheme cytochrome c family protein